MKECRKRKNWSKWIQTQTKAKKNETKKLIITAGHLCGTWCNYPLFPFQVTLSLSSFSFPSAQSPNSPYPSLLLLLLQPQTLHLTLQLLIFPSDSVPLLSLLSIIASINVAVSRILFFGEMKRQFGFGEELKGPETACKRGSRQRDRGGRFRTIFLFFLCFVADFPDLRFEF